MTKADMDELLTMAFMRGAESVGLEALAAFAERLSTHPTLSDMDELLTMAFMRGAESVGLEALAFAERLSTHPTLSDYDIELGQRVMRMFAEQLANGLLDVSTGGAT